VVAVWLNGSVMTSINKSLYVGSGQQYLATTSWVGILSTGKSWA